MQTEVSSSPAQVFFAGFEDSSALAEDVQGLKVRGPQAGPGLDDSTRVVAARAAEWG